MVSKIVRMSLLIFFLSVATSYAQTDAAMEKEREKYFQKQYQEYNDRVDSYINLLKVDDFKVAIIKQKIEEFYRKRNQIMMTEVSEFEKQPLVEQLKATHFSDVEELYTEETINSIQRFLTDNKAEIKKLQKTKKNK